MITGHNYRILHINFRITSKQKPIEETGNWKGNSNIIQKENVKSTSKKKNRRTKINMKTPKNKKIIPIFQSYVLLEKHELKPKREHFTCVRMAYIKMTANKCWQGYGEKGNFHTLLVPFQNGATSGKAV